AYRAAAHLWARDLARLATASPGLARAAERWARGDEWACLVRVDGFRAGADGWRGEALFVPARGGRSLLLLAGGAAGAAPGRARGGRGRDRGGPSSRWRRWGCAGPGWPASGWTGWRRRRPGPRWTPTGWAASGASSAPPT